MKYKINKKHYLHLGFHGSFNGCPDPSWFRRRAQSTCWTRLSTKWFPSFQASALRHSSDRPSTHECQCSVCLWIRWCWRDACVRDHRWNRPCCQRWSFSLSCRFSPSSLAAGRSSATRFVRKERWDRCSTEVQWPLVGQIKEWKTYVVRAAVRVARWVLYPTKNVIINVKSCFNQS